MKRTVVILSLLLIVTACEYGAPSRIEAPADTVEGAISFELGGMGGAALLVPVHLNGHGPHQFVLDTGATLTCVSNELADSLDLPERSGQFGAGVGIQGAGRVELVGVDSLRVGETRAFDISVCRLDLSQLEQAGLRVDGLLGLNFLKSFRMVVDFGTNTLLFQEL